MENRNVMVTDEIKRRFFSFIPGGEGFKTKQLYQWVPLASIVMLATLLRLYQLGVESLWVDEFHSLRAAVELKLHFRVLYFALLRLWMLVSNSDAWLRSLSAIFGIACVLIIYHLGYQLVSKKTGLLAAFIISVSPLFIRHSQEVRLYMLSTFLTMTGTLALIHTFEKVTFTSVGCWLGARLLAIYATPINLLLLLPDAVIGLTRFRKQQSVLVGIAGAMAVPILLFLPVLLNPEFISAISRFMSKASADGRALGVPEILGQLPAATVFWPMSQLPKEQLWFYGLCSLALLFPIGFLVFNKRRSARLGWLATWAFLPLVVLLLVSLLQGYLWSPRYLLIATPYVVILLSAGFLQVWNWNRFVAFGIVSIYSVALGGGLLHYYGAINVTDWRGAVQEINNSEMPGDAIVVPSEFLSDLVFARYYLGENPIYVVESLKSFREVEQATIEQDLVQLPIKSRLWLLYVRSKEDNPHGQVVSSVVKDRFETQKHKVYSGYLDTLDLFLLTPNSAS
jgi:mannosyltransferase